MTTNDLTPREPEPDDGFSGSLTSGRVNRGSYLKWTDADHWIDRDGLTPSSTLLVIAVDEALQRWKDNQPDYIRDKPLPDLEQLNAAIPEAEWERGIDGKPRRPWAHIIIVYLVDPRVGTIYTYSSPTTGARIAYDALKEAVITMRALRGVRVMPIVGLNERPFKTNFGMRRRPHFEILGWKTPGDDMKAVAPTPQLASPAVAPAAPPSDAPATPSSPAPTPSSDSTPPYQAKPKPPVNLGHETLSAMGDVKPVTMSEIVDDEIPW